MEASRRRSTDRPRGAYHFAHGSNGEIQVFEVWVSHEEFEAFGTTLMPILSGLDVNLGEPMVATVHNVIKG